MSVRDLLILTSADVQAALEGRETEILDQVRLAYLAHHAGRSVLPHSSFLKIQGLPNDRIIALPAYLDGTPPIVGLKWISSFPGNTERGLDRASAVIMLNSLTTGRVEVIMEGSIISMKRTAASAILAAQKLHSSPSPNNLGLVGCGPINHEIARFAHFLFPDLKKVTLFDLSDANALMMARACKPMFPESSVVHGLNLLLEQCDLVSFATTAAVPYVEDLSMCPPGCTILHISLRDIAPQVVLSSNNIVDDPDHVCKAATSAHLAEQARGNRQFIRCGIGEVLEGVRLVRDKPDETVIFHPFGLGILDLSLARLVCGILDPRRGTVIEFHPHQRLRTVSDTVPD